ncbi:MAG: NUDIX domain-containing protein [Treponema sp.]|nr:NUDIX domain-containing protein [Treponema sp.]
MSRSVACIIFDGKKVLIAHRNPVGDMGNRWEFPGGKIDGEESPSQAIVREMMEEFSVKAHVGEKITENTFVHKNKECSLEAYLVTLEHDGIEKPFVLTEHTEYKWVFPEEIKDLSFVDSDLKIYPDVLEFLKNKEAK